MEDTYRREAGPRPGLEEDMKSIRVPFSTRVDPEKEDYGARQIARHLLNHAYLIGVDPDGVSNTTETLLTAELTEELSRYLGLDRSTTRDLYYQTRAGQLIDSFADVAAQALKLNRADFAETLDLLARSDELSYPFSLGSGAATNETGEDT